MGGLREAPGIVPALDTTLGKALSLAYELRDSKDKITFLKYGSFIMDPWGYKNSLPHFQEVAPELPIVIDRHKGGTDIPEVVRNQVLEVKNYSNVVGMIAAPLGAGSYRDLNDLKKIGTLEAFVDTCFEHPAITPIIVVEMSQPGALAFSEEKYADKLCKTCLDYNVKYIVAPATRPQRITNHKRIAHELNKEGIEIISPAVGPQKTGDPLKDAIDAVAAGTDHVVAGRSIFKHLNPKQAKNNPYLAILPVHTAR